MTKEFLEDFIQCITSYNWPLIIVTVRLLYPMVLHHYFIICCNIKCFLLFNICFVNDIISAATLQGHRADILTARRYSVIHSTAILFRVKYFIFSELFSTGAGLVAASMIAIVPGYISRCQMFKNVFFFWGRIFSCARPFYEQAVSDLDDLVYA